MPRTDRPQRTHHRAGGATPLSSNSFGKLFTVTTFGESHGPALGCIVVGCPPGMELSERDLQHALDRQEVHAQVPFPVPTPATFVRDVERLEALGITPRELEILALIAEGLSNREIAGALGAGEATVKTHVSSILSKMGVRDRTRAVLRGLELGFV